MRKSDSEAAVHERIVQYLKLKHPGVIFRTDFAAGLKLPIWLAARQRKLQYKRGFPDLFIYKPMGDFHGLALEIKKPGTRLKKQDGTWASDHIKEQAQMMDQLNHSGYMTAFAVGYDMAVDIMDLYLSGKQLVTLDHIVVDYKGPKLMHEQEDVF